MASTPIFPAGPWLLVLPSKTIFLTFILFIVLMPDRGWVGSWYRLVRLLGTGVGTETPSETETRVPALGQITHKKFKDN